MEKTYKNSFQLIFLLGIVSLFGDITYEGARGVIGPYLAILGASVWVVGLISGLGEFLGYGLRIFSGYISDRTKAYWLIIISGYGLLFSIPLLAFSGNWQIAVILIILERIGKAIRTPARDTILSLATKEVGRGRGFGIHEALDQIGAIGGPLIFSLVFLLKGRYSQGFMILGIPFLLTLIFLILAKKKFPLPEKLENFNDEMRRQIKVREDLSKTFWFYSLFTFLTVCGLANFVLISYHFKIHSLVSDIGIPIFYALAMGIDAFVALIIGRIYDRFGLISLITIPILTLFIPFFGFSYSYNLALIGILFWGAITGIHQTVMRAAIADLITIEHRGLAYGIFNTTYGLASFLGASIIGLLYGISIKYLFLFVIITQITSLFFLYPILRAKQT